MNKTVIVGLDCADPSLLFDRFADELPHFNQVRARAIHGPLRSCHPPITVPAWSVLTSGRTPGELGVYGFRNRATRAYDDYVIAKGDAIHVPRIWDYVGRAGGQNIVIGVPQSWPSPPIRGYLVGGLFADLPTFTQPATLGRRLLQRWPQYQTDVRNFRNANKKNLLQRLRKMAQTRFEAAIYMMRNYPWDFFMLVEIGLDRVQHAFWQFMDAQSPYYMPDSGFENAVRDYYRLLDKLFGQLLRIIPENSDLWVVSDHGAQTMQGLFRINQWLIHKGYLTLKHTPAHAQPLTAAMVDWQRTRAWADGGYYARLWFNVKGREPEGIIPMEETDTLKRELISALSTLHTEAGNLLTNQVMDPGQIYPCQEEIAPDLMLYVERLSHRVSASVGGNEGLFTTVNDTGPDGANHAQDGLYIFRPGGGTSETYKPASIYDVTPTVLRRMGVKGEKALRGRIVYA